MNGQNNIHNLIAFSTVVYEGVHMMSKKDIFSNMQLYTERTLGIDYFTSCQVSEQVTKVLWKNKSKDLSKGVIAGLVASGLNSWAKKQKKSK